MTGLLAKHGAIVFRGIPIDNAADFSKFSHAFGYQPHEIIGIVVDRPELAPNVAPANKAPKSTTIGSHNESPQVPHAPGYVFFYGHAAPPVGGETPLGSSLEIYDIVKRKNPKIIEELSEKGVRNEIIYRKQPAYAGNSTIFQAFGKHIKPEDDEETRIRKMEYQIKRYNRDRRFTFHEWLDDGSLKVTNIVPPIRRQPKTGYPGFFTSLAARYEVALRGKDEEQAKVQSLPSFGDGTPIPEEYLETILQATLESRVLHKWQRGDVIAIDNRIAQHGRLPWGNEDEDRVIQASLWDAELPEPFNDSPLSQLDVPLEDNAL